MRQRFFSLMPFGILLTLSNHAGAAPSACAEIDSILKGPQMVSYRIETRARKVAGTAIPGGTSVLTTTSKAIPGGVQMTMTQDGKSNVIKKTCVAGKVKTEMNGKVLPSDAAQAASGGDMGAVAATDFAKRKVGETWSGTLFSSKTDKLTSEASYKNKLLGTEKLTTPAGTFDTYKVQMQLNTKIIMKDMPTYNSDTTTSYTYWYARNVPNLAVKMTSDGMSMTLLKYQK